MLGLIIGGYIGIACGAFVPLVRWRVKADLKSYPSLEGEYGVPTFEAIVMSLFWPIALLLWPLTVGGRKLVKYIVESEHREKKVKQS